MLSSNEPRLHMYKQMMERRRSMTLFITAILGIKFVINHR